MTLIHSTIFNGADTALGAAGTSSGLGDGNIDLFGSALNIQGGHAINHRGGGSDYWRNFGARPTSENVQNGKSVFAFAYSGGGDHAVAGVRFNASTGAGYAARFDSGNLYLFNLTGGGAWGDLQITPCPLVAGNVYFIACTAQSTDSTHTNLTAGVYSDSALTSPIATAVVVNDTIGPQAAGQFIFGGWTSAAAGVSFSTYDLGANIPNVGVPNATASDTSNIALSMTAGSGGTGPYSYQWHCSRVDPAFTPSAATAITGATGLTFTHANLSPGARGFYICRVTDANGQTNDSPVVSATTYRHVFRIAEIGDSLTAGAVGDTGPNIGSLIGARLAALGGPNLVTIVNGSVGGTTIDQWLPSAAPLAGQSTGLWTQLTSAIAGAGGVTHCLVCIGANDAAIMDRSLFIIYLRQLIAALSGLGIRAILDDVPPPKYDGTAATASANARILNFNAAMDGLVDNHWVFRGARMLYAYAGDHQSNFQDPVHPDGTARQDWSTIRAAAAMSVLVPPGRSVNLSTGVFQAA